MLKHIRLTPVIIIGLALLFICSESAFAQWIPSKATDTEKPQDIKKAPEATVSEKAAQEEAAKRALMIDAARKELDNNAWSITLTEQTDKPKRDIKEDTIRFTDNGRMASEFLLSEGFRDSNISIRIRRENRLVWETMQQGQDGAALAFWRGDMNRDPKTGELSDTMSGVLSIHKNDKNKTVVNYTFTSGTKSRISDEVSAKSAVERPSTAQQDDEAALISYEAEKAKPETTTKKRR